MSQHPEQVESDTFTDFAIVSLLSLRSRRVDPRIEAFGIKRNDKSLFKLIYITSEPDGIFFSTKS